MTQLYRACAYSHHPSPPVDVTHEGVLHHQAQRDAIDMSNLAPMPTIMMTEPHMGALEPKSRSTSRSKLACYAQVCCKHFQCLQVSMQLEGTWKSGPSWAGRRSAAS